MDKKILDSIENKYYGSAIELGQQLAGKLSIDPYEAMRHIKNLMETGYLISGKPGYFSKV